ncbi:hypothetical protein PG301_10090 [Parageobacillus sp. G301]|jgi:hypothetical protein|nr:hypothetical protein PG301_10090 [Parageobacillus sp. G301]
MSGNVASTTKTTEEHQRMLHQKRFLPHQFLAFDRKQRINLTRFKISKYINSQLVWFIC